MPIALDRWLSRPKGIWRGRALPVLLRMRLRPETRRDMIRLGSDYGGWWIPSAVLAKNRLAYCAGVGGDMSFDRALLDRGLIVRTFDPTPRAIEYVRQQGLPTERFSFDPVGWWGEETTLRFYAPENASHVSHSVVNLQNTTSFFEAEVAPVQRFIDQYGDRDIALVKMDIEGAEHEVIEALLQTEVRPLVIAVEFDDPQTTRVVSTTAALRTAGYQLVKIERWNYTYAHSELDRTVGSQA